MSTFIKTGLWENSTTAQVPKGWLNLTKLIKDNSKTVSEILTPENIGQFMDEGLVTKLTPNGNDTLLARDFLTNEAVEITIASIAENPEFLINCLNSATPAQLSTIKSILGIV